MNIQKDLSILGRNIIILTTLLLIGTIVLLPNHASAKTKRPPITASGQFSIDAQGGQRNYNFSMTQLSNECYMNGSDMVGCNGGGTLKYTDYQNNAYAVDVKYVNKQGNNVYFAGPVFSASHQDQVGNWLYGQVTDNGNGPYRSLGNRNNASDQVSGNFMNEDAARQKVANQGPTGMDFYTVNNGNVNARVQQHYNVRPLRIR